MPAFLVLAAIFSSLVCKKALSLMEAGIHVAGKGVSFVQGSKEEESQEGKV